MKSSIIGVILISSFLLTSCSSERDERSQSQRVALETLTQVAPDGSSKIKKVRADLDDAKGTLAEEGKYSCCIKDACDFCALHEASCTCYKDLTAGEHVCIECYAGWQQGKGTDPKIKKENVTTSFVGHEHSR